jgi:GxxExxY protein
MLDEAEKREIDILSNKIIGAAIEVHKCLGPGLMERAYEKCLCKELALMGIAYERQKLVPVSYKGQSIDCGFRVDLLVEDKLIIEIKSVNALLPIHEAQLMTYLKLSNLWLGLLINFNVVLLRDGIKRIVLGY